jgi:hypothetical protein
VGFYDWMLAVHLLAAFAVAAALVLFSVIVVAGRRMSTLEETRLLFRVAPIGTPLIAGGMLVALVAGVVLALDADDFELWDPWVIAGIVLLAILGGIGQRTGAYYTEVQKVAEGGAADAESDVLARLRAPTGARLHVITVAVFLVLVLDMIFKPGA